MTLLFGLPRYRQVVKAYIAGIEARAVQGKPVKHVASVASFFVSRIDSLVAMIEPTLTVVIGVVVIFIALSMITPLYSIIRTMP